MLALGAVAGAAGSSSPDSSYCIRVTADRACRVVSRWLSRWLLHRLLVVLMLMLLFVVVGLHPLLVSLGLGVLGVLAEFVAVVERGGGTNWHSSLRVVAHILITEQIARTI